jgi:ATP-dependent DNA helicase RecQ
MPSQAKAEAVLHALAGTSEGAPLSTPALEARVDLRRSPLELLLKVLDVDGAVRRVKGGWISTGQPWTYDKERYDRIAAARLNEQNAMLDYERSTGCRMEFLQRALDDDTAVPCGRCDNCAGAWYPTDVATEAASAAAASLDRVGVLLEPRAQWPTGVASLGVTVDGVAVRGNIAPGERLEPGRALARLSDLGWGGALRTLFDPSPSQGGPGADASLGSTPGDAPASAAMLAACIRVLADWNWAERPVAVVSMPSRRHPLLVESVARAFSEAGRLPWLGSLELKNGGPTGTAGGNSAYRLSNVWDRFEVGPELAGSLAGFSGPVLLVDDLADSRWTLVVAGRLLRRAGATAVLPFALALRS